MRPVGLGQPPGVTPAARLDWAISALKQIESASRQPDLRLSDDAILYSLGFLPYIGTLATTDATESTILTIPARAETTMILDGYVVARRTGGASGTAEDGAGYVIRATVKNVGGTATLIDEYYQEAEDQAGWDASYSMSSGNVLVRVTGAASNNINWRAVVRMVRVS